MKKTYEPPKMENIDMDCSTQLLAGSVIDEEHHGHSHECHGKNPWCD